METYSRIGLLRSYGNLQSYWTTTTPWKLTVVLDYYFTSGWMICSLKVLKLKTLKLLKVRFSYFYTRGVDSHLPHSFRV